MVNDEEDSDDEDVGMAGYVPLSQISTDVDPILEREESYSSEILQVWSCPHNRSDIDLDATKIKEVKSVMASITLP
ncbi:hypothetical protein RF55_25266, partial [Lasius niger]